MNKIDEINNKLSQEVAQQRQKISEGIVGVKKTLLLDLDSRVAQDRENHLIVIQQIEEKNKNIIQQKDEIINKLTNSFNNISLNQTQTPSHAETAKTSTVISPYTSSSVHELNILPKDKDYHGGEIIKAIKEFLNIEEIKLKIIAIRNSPKGIFIKFEMKDDVAKQILTENFPA